MMIDIFNQVQVLHISNRFIYNEMYTNANRWEQLILSHMPNLRILDVQYDNITTDNHNDNQAISNTPFDNFTSSFWIKRQSFFTQQNFQERYENRTILYSTDPYRETHLQSLQHLKIQNDKETINCKFYFPNVTTLTLQNKLSNTHNLFSFNLSCVIPLKQLIKLVIKCQCLSLIKLIELLRCTPHIHTLVLKAMSLYGANYNSIQQNESFQLASSTNTSTNVTYEGKCTLAKLQILIALFSRIQHLTIDLHDKDFESCIRFLLEKTNRNTNNLCSLCLLSVKNIWRTGLKTLIESETLLDDYMLKINNKQLYLWW
ncbi:unnamed protein product [Adineta steineri]|uniref:Uncharacterized protein n=1 Tax=Adineta steineri TaxID=433720 RepID=A0A814IQ23_9BILA|nr:unnamed protein product [Adineta steineri]CAF1119940.1 unnamed protein product [Adineta steineri]